MRVLLTLILALGWAQASTCLGGKQKQWVDLWTAMPQLTEPANLPMAPYNGTLGVFGNATIRQTFKLTLGTDTIRFRVTNQFGATPLEVTGMTVAYPSDRGVAGTSTIDEGSVRSVTFSGGQGIVVPTSALATSDPVSFNVQAGDIVTVSLYLANGQDGFAITSHPGSRVTSWIGDGDQSYAGNVTGQSLAHWYYLSAIEGYTTGACAFAIVGDSITDGRGSETDKNNRWPDELYARMQGDAFAKDVSPVNQAAGGNRILQDGLGPNAWSRIGRDVLAHPSTRYAMIFEGVNDIGTADNTTEAQDDVYNRLLVAYDQIITQVHSFRIPIFAATITPFSAPNSTIQPYSDPLREQTRQRTNHWLLTSGKFDHVVDFAAAVEDPDQPDRLAPAYNSGDFLHLNPAGYRRMAEVFDLGVFERFAVGVDS